MGMDKKDASESFDHVLIDVNQLLHVSVRKSKSDDHALTLLMMELNSCIQVARPTKSLVLAMDGSPSAAKLAMSRKRRLSTLVKTEWKQRQLERLRKSKKLSLSDSQIRQMSRKYACGVETLKITTGTYFMEKANQAVLYWAWQKLISMDSPLAKVSIYISTSESPGEGEVKLLDWMFQKKPKGTVALVGGDSDLVLEGLVIPPEMTHNCFVLLPDKSKRYLVVSIWEATRQLAALLPKLDAKDIMRVRIDVVLLLIMNGNDYLPKLRGSSGFDPIFKNYIKVVTNWLNQGKANPFLVEPDKLEFHKEFAVEFFSSLKSQRHIDTASEVQSQATVNTLTPIGYLHNLSSNKFMPKPVRFKVLRKKTSDSGIDEEEEIVLEDDDEDDEEEGDEEEDDDDEEEEEEIAEGEIDFDAEVGDTILRLSLGKEGSDNYFHLEAPLEQGSDIKDVKNKLAMEAMNDLVGEDFFKEDDTTGAPGGSSGYSWEIDVPVQADLDSYLGGLLWNLQTYQDGLCSDYSYNYGKRLSPTATELAEYFLNAIDEERVVDKISLLGRRYAQPVNKGITCLAAMPSQLSELMLPPYNQIASSAPLVESLYEKCMDPHDNAFQLHKFATLCEIEIAKLGHQNPQIHTKNNKGTKKGRRSAKKGRRNLQEIELESNSWTVLSRRQKMLTVPFEPPVPVISGFTVFKVNKRIRATNFKACPQPRPRAAWGDEPKRFEYVPSNMTKFISELAENGDSVFDVEYWTPYPNQWPAKRRAKKRTKRKKASNKQEIDATENRQAATEWETNKWQGIVPSKISDQELHDRMEKFQVEMEEPIHFQQGGVKGRTPLTYLTHLQDVGMIDFEFKSIVPSPTEFASFRPDAFECIQLVVRKGDVPMNSTFQGELIFQRDRERTRGASKRLLRQYLAVEALTRLLSHKGVVWYEHSFVDLQKILLPDSEPILETKRSPDALQRRMDEFKPTTLGPVTKSRTNRTAMQYLSLLDKGNFVSATFSCICPSSTEVASIKPTDFECIRLHLKKGLKTLPFPIKRDRIFERDRHVRSPVQRVRQHLAEEALTHLLSFQEKPWTQCSYKEVKDLLTPQAAPVSNDAKTEQQVHSDYNK